MDITEILKQVVALGASDLHLSVGVPPVVRIDGHLEALDYPPLDPIVNREMVYSILSQDQRQKLETDWELDLAYSLYGVARFRVNAFFQRGAIAAAFRMVPIEIKAIDDLGLPKILHSFCHKPRGFVLVTGPTGSGKSTTLGRHHRRDQSDPVASHRHHRGSHRVLAHAQAVRGQSERARCRHQVVSGSACALLCARTLTWSSSVR